MISAGGVGVCQGLGVGVVVGVTVGVSVGSSNMMVRFSAQEEIKRRRSNGRYFFIEYIISFPLPESS
jgi:hypothetical protein